MKEDLKAQTEQAFQQQFSTTPQLVCFSPGRINLLGEHIDYNAGFVLPAAIDKYVCVALAPTTGDSRRHTLLKMRQHGHSTYWELWTK